MTAAVGSSGASWSPTTPVNARTRLSAGGRDTTDRQHRELRYDTGCEHRAQGARTAAEVQCRQRESQGSDGRARPRQQAGGEVQPESAVNKRRAGFSEPGPPSDPRDRPRPRRLRRPHPDPFPTPLRARGISTTPAVGKIAATPGQRHGQAQRHRARSRPDSRRAKANESPVHLPQTGQRGSPCRVTRHDGVPDTGGVHAERRAYGPGCAGLELEQGLGLGVFRHRRWHSCIRGTALVHVCVPHDSAHDVFSSRRIASTRAAIMRLPIAVPGIMWARWKAPL